VERPHRVRVLVTPRLESKGRLSFLDADDVNSDESRHGRRDLEPQPLDHLVPEGSVDRFEHLHRSSEQSA